MKGDKMELKQATILFFCPICHKIKRLGVWVVIDEEISRILKYNNNWSVNWTKCPDCEKIYAS